MGLPTLSTAELIEMRDAVKAAWLRSLNAVSYGISTRQISRAQPDQLFKQLQALDKEIAARQGNQIIQAAFPDDYGELHEDDAS